MGLRGLPQSTLPAKGAPLETRFKLKGAFNQVLPVKNRKNHMIEQGHTSIEETLFFVDLLMN